MGRQREPEALPEVSGERGQGVVVELDHGAAPSAYEVVVDVVGIGGVVHGTA